MDIVQLLSAAGIGGIIGSLLTTFAQAWFSHRSYLANRDFQEKKEAYVGFLEAFNQSEIRGTEEAAVRAGYWVHRCELVGSAQVRKLIQRVTETNPSNGQTHPDRPQVMAELKAAMRGDLDVRS